MRSFLARPNRIPPVLGVVATCARRYPAPRFEDDAERLANGFGGPETLIFEQVGPWGRTGRPLRFETGFLDRLEPIVETRLKARRSTVSRGLEAVHSPGARQARISRGSPNSRGSPIRVSGLKLSTSKMPSLRQSSRRCTPMTSPKTTKIRLALDLHDLRQRGIRDWRALRPRASTGRSRTPPVRCPPARTRPSLSATDPRSGS